VGGGVIGAACARAAARRGLRVTIFEPGPPAGAATPAAAGMLASQVEPMDEALLALSVRARDLYASLAPGLQGATGIDLRLWRDGIATLALDERDADRLRERARQQHQAGLRAEWLEPQAVRTRWPGVSPACRGAVLAPDDGAIDPAALGRAFTADARRLGAEIVPHRVAALLSESGRVTGVEVDGMQRAFGHVVLAGGAWSALVPGLPRTLPVKPVRGQMAATRWPADTPPVILYHDHCYVLARGGEALLGSTMENAGFDPQVTREGLARIVRSTAALLPAVKTLPVERSWAGLRPVTPDGAPIVGPDPDVRGLWYATGHGRNGILLAGLTGEAIGDLLELGTSGLDISSWRVERFAQPNARG
jgi:glycine oxidase